jgi:hypothetical protein
MKRDIAFGVVLLALSACFWWLAWFLSHTGGQ